MKSLLLTIAAFLTVSTAQAKIEVLFHPHDPTLEKIALWIEEAKTSVDIAMYNMETGSASPIIQTLQSDSIQNRLRRGDLKIRLALELYGTPEENEAKRKTMEDLGVDVRYLGKSIKAHHKFAVIDAGSPHSRVITGSANWSLSSYRGYNENILFFTQEPEATARFQTEFNRIWINAKEFGRDFGHGAPAAVSYEEQHDLEVFFNSPKTLDKGSAESSVLTDKVVTMIDNARHSLQIASTRIRLLPVMEALLRAAERGVQIQAIISQDDYRDLGRRAKYLLQHKNIDLRVKFYNLDLSDYMRFQMHNKFMIVDNQSIVTGSFNWSESSENKHIENIVILAGAAAQQVLPEYKNEFTQIFNLGRDEFAGLYQSVRAQQHKDCAIPQMALYPHEIRQLLKASSCRQAVQN